MADSYKPLKRKIKLTKRQSQVLEAIKKLTDKSAQSPTFNEVSKSVGFNAKDALVSLRRRGCVTWGRRAQRSLRILREPTGKSGKLVRTDVGKPLPALKAPLAKTVPTPSPILAKVPFSTKAGYTLEDLKKVESELEDNLQAVRKVIKLVERLA